uniref:ATP synthase F0 subunit 8 n=1 Tax=Eurytoma sp. TJS-2016 TaxID=1855182 RepID=A0A1X9HXF0_9HYME|nr:ATP synthase F0 subunit 8 [Eurytoma sp. TJS-2016]
MPQMSPLNWLVLYIYLIMILIIVNLIFNNLYMSVKQNKDFKLKNKIFMKWMW